MPKVAPAHKVQRRQQILEAAARCFDREGLHGSSMQDILAEAQLSAGAVYNYFPSKESIITALAERRHADEATLVATALAADDPNVALHRLADLFFQWLTDPDEQQRRRIGVQVWAEALHVRALHDVVAAGTDQRRLLIPLIRRAQRRRQLRRTLDADAVARVFLSLFQGFVLQQAWDSQVDVAGYLRVLHALIDVLVLSAP